MALSEISTVMSLCGKLGGLSLMSTTSTSTRNSSSGVSRNTSMVSWQLELICLQMSSRSILSFTNSTPVSRFTSRYGVRALGTTWKRREASWVRSSPRSSAMFPTRVPRSASSGTE